MTGYARKHESLPVVSFITFYSGNPSMHQRIAEAALRKNVVVVILSAVKRNDFR
ncbi:hypothetical protein NUACC26_050990 [Scytonema sp. NUACC26]